MFIKLKKVLATYTKSYDNKCCMKSMYVAWYRLGHLNSQCKYNIIILDKINAAITFKHSATLNSLNTKIKNIFVTLASPETLVLLETLYLYSTGCQRSLETLESLVTLPSLEILVSL